ncbi:hypothetical protein [Candidatus Magnetaquiglobus chichijimensis]
MAEGRDLSWLREEIALGLSKCVLLRLPGYPAADVIEFVAEVWLEAILSAPIYWTENLDRLRIRQAFIALTRVHYQWPTPAILLDHLPPRAAVMSLPEPPMSEEQLAKNLEMIRKLRQDLESNLGMDQKKPYGNPP